MNLSQVLLESRKDDFLRMFRDKFSDEQLKKVFTLSRQLAPNQKFLTFLGNVVPTENFDESLSKAEKVVEKFIKYQQALETRDINQFKSLEEIITAINNHENKVRRTVKSVDGANIVYEDDRFTVVTPQTHKASCYYGAGTKWCTASMNGSSHFDRYNQDGKLFYIIDKKAKSQDRFYKVALLNKYDGNQTFYDAPDKAFNEGWILGSEQWNKMNVAIQDYIQSKFKREIEIFKDKEAARLEMERIRREQQAERTRQKLQSQRERKENDEWNLNNNPDEMGIHANAVFNILDELNVDVGEDESVYNLVPADHGHMGLTTFEWLGEDEQGKEIAVGDWDQVWEAAKDYYQNVWDEMGIEGWNRDFIESHLDTRKVEDYFEEMYESMIDDDPQSYFDEDELPLSEEQQQEVEKLREEIEEMNDIVNHSEDEEHVSYAEERIEEIESEIQDIQDSPEGEPTVGQIEDKVQDMLYDVRQDPLSYLNDYGFDITDFVDVDELIEDSLNYDGVGPALSSYDGEVYESLINGEWYHVVIVE